MKRCSTTGKSSAFTLIEVIIAVARFAMAATVLSSSFVNALLARERSVSNQVLTGDLAIIRKQLLLEPDREAAEEGASCETLQSGEAKWYAEIEETEIVDFFRVQLHVDFLSPPEGQAETHKENLYLLRPTWSDAADRSSLRQEKTDALLQSRNFDRF